MQSQPRSNFEIREELEQMNTIDLSELSRLRMDIKDSLKHIADEEKELKKTASEIEELALSRMENEGMLTTKNHYSNIVIKEDKFPSVQDWGALVEFIKEHDAWQLFQRRLSASAFNEICEIIDGIPPGVEIFEKTTAKFTDTRR